MRLDGLDGMTNLVYNPMKLQRKKLWGQTACSWEIYLFSVVLPPFCVGIINKKFSCNRLCVLCLRNNSTTSIHRLQYCVNNTKNQVFSSGTMCLPDIVV